MRTVGRELVGECATETLIADASVSLDVVTCKVAKTSSETTLKRGTVLALNVTTGECAIASGAEGTTAAYVLAEDVKTSKSAAVVAEVYQTGKFVRESLIVADKYTLSNADIKALRDAGIFVESAIL